ITSESGTRLLSRKPAPRASTGALERCDPGAASPAFRLTYHGEKTTMTAFIRSLCLSALLAAGAAWAQQQPVDNPDNPHSTKAKDKQTSDVSSSTTNPQVNQAEQGSPRSPQNKDVAAGQTTAMTDKDQMSGMDHDMM